MKTTPVGYGREEVKLTILHPETIPSAPLTRVEEQRLASLESHIAEHHHRAVDSIYEAGLALLEIQSERLYRAQYKTFEQYCASKWDVHRSYGYRMLQAGKLKQVLSPTGDIPLPDNERQIRVLCALETDTAKAVWNRALKESGKRKITAEVLVEIAEKLAGPDEKKPRPQFAHWQQEARKLLLQAADAVNANQLDDCLTYIDKARIRVEIEYQKEMRVSGEMA